MREHRDPGKGNRKWEILDFQQQLVFQERSLVFKMRLGHFSRYRLQEKLFCKDTFACQELEYLQIWTSELKKLYQNSPDKLLSKHKASMWNLWKRELVVKLWEINDPRISKNASKISCTRSYQCCIVHWTWWQRKYKEMGSEETRRPGGWVSMKFEKMK